MDDEELEEEEEYTGPTRRRFQIIDLGVVGLGFCEGVADAASAAFSTLRDLVAMHANYTQHQRNFHEEVARDIETLTSGELDG